MFNRKFSINRHTGVPKPETRRFSVGEPLQSGKHKNMAQIYLAHLVIQMAVYSSKQTVVE